MKYFLRTLLIATIAAAIVIATITIAPLSVTSIAIREFRIYQNPKLPLLTPVAVPVRANTSLAFTKVTR